MEKYLKKLSIANIILPALFFLGLSGAARAQSTNTPQFIISTLSLSVDILLLAVPIAYVVLLVFFTIALFRRYLNAQEKFKKKEFDKLPILWFVIATFCFVGYFFFINMLFNAL